MRFNDLFGSASAELATIILTLVLPTTVGAASFTPVPSPNLDLSQLGRVALTGDFDSIALYTYEGQNENGFSTNGSQSLLAQLPNGAFSTLASSDAYIVTMCPFIRKNGDLAGVVLGGNFTSMSGTKAQGVALWDPTTSSITPLPGLSGSVNALYCDQDTDSVFVGGDFMGANSTNALVWIGSGSWSNMPFAGFNGPVNSITKAPDGNIIFGGSFSGLGNTTTPTVKDQQVINLSTANISAVATTTTAGFSDPQNILCKTEGQDGAGNTWLLEDQSPGSWRADMSFGFEPTKLRLWNTQQDGRGTKTFRFTAYPLGGILKMWFIDSSGQNATCDQTCPLAANNSAQDFHFINVLGMNSFQVDISAWYGNGAGLDGIELFQDDIYAYAVSDFDEPACAASTFGAKSTVTGPWKVTPSQQSNAEYLTVNLTGPGVNSSSASVTFLPDIKQSGNYTVTIFTPGCQQDSDCTSRGISNVTGIFSANGTTVQSNVYQTNDFDKYDQIYHGYVDASSDSFRPSVTLQPLSNQNDSISLVAQRVRFQLLAATSSGLNGLFEYNPNEATIDPDFSNSKVDVAGTSLNQGAEITTLSVIGQTTYIGGNFTTSNFSNIFSMTDGNSGILANGGLNNAVASTYVFGNSLYIGGNFTNTQDNSVDGLKYVAVYDTSKNAWSPLGGGVNGPVTNIVPLTLNITANTPETCISINGDFTQVLQSGSSQAFDASGLAIWSTSRNQWMNDLSIQTQAISGQLTAATNVTGSTPLLAGTVSSLGLALSDSAELSASSGTPSLSTLGLKISTPSGGSSVSKRATTTQNATGVMTALFDTDTGYNLTILAGHFAATAADGSTVSNLAFINNTGSGQTLTGLAPGIDSGSTFQSLARNGTTLYAGGMVTGNVNSNVVNGIIVWQLDTSSFASQQLPALGGDSPSVTSISIRPDSADLYVAGNFDSAGGLGCQSVCIFTGGQWSVPGIGFGGNVSSTLWQGNDKLLVAGDLSISNNETSLANYDATAQTWSVVDGASAVPGPVTVLTPGNTDSSSYWIAGNAANGSCFLMLYDGSNFQTTPAGLDPSSTIHGLSVLSLTQSHGDNDLLDSMMALLITGDLSIPNFGNASAALFNGTDYTPFLLSNSGNGPGSLRQVVTEQQQTFNSGGGGLKLAYVILIALAIALALIALLIALGLLIERRRKRTEGYRPAPQNIYEKTTTNMGRIPPEHLFGNIGSPGGPRV